MVKKVFNLLLVSLMLASSAYASDAKLKSEYGQDLTHAPFIIRYAFYNELHEEWGKSDYAQRKAFLTNYDRKLKEEQRLDKAEARAESNHYKEILSQKKVALRKKEQIQRAEADEDKEEQRADEERQNSFAREVEQQQRELNQMQSQSTHTIN